jgi:hypothetical protein
MNNPKTTIAGTLMIAGAILTIAAHALQGAISVNDVTALLAALGGLGLVAAKDGDDGPVTKAIKRNFTVGMFAIVTLGAAFSGCSTISVTCPDGKSTASWKGPAIFGNTSVGCAATKTGVTASVSGVDVVAIAAAVMPLVAPLMAQQQQLLQNQATPPDRAQTGPGAPGK